MKLLKQMGLGWSVETRAPKSYKPPRLGVSPQSWGNSPGIRPTKILVISALSFRLSEPARNKWVIEKDFLIMRIQWGSEIWPTEIRTVWRLDFKWSGLSYGYSYGYSCGSNHSKTGHFCPCFKWFLTKMAATFKWLGLWITDPIWNPD